MASVKAWFRRIVLSAVAAVLVLYSGLTTWLWWAQDSLVFWTEMTRFLEESGFGTGP